MSGSRVCILLISEQVEAQLAGKENDVLVLTLFLLILLQLCYKRQLGEFAFTWGKIQYTTSMLS